MIKSILCWKSSVSQSYTIARMGNIDMDIACIFLTYFVIVFPPDNLTLRPVML